MNISAIKTPGVYINEIDAFPPSIAQVATAIPAFVGYTQKATSLNVPTRISSLMEYEQFFGGAPAPGNIVAEVDSNYIPTDNCSVTESKFKLYNSMRLFYANGGGECYIVSIGLYTSNPSFDATTKGKFTDGIDKLEKYDEPTLILFPDAVNLSAANLGAVQVHSLMQCQKLMDRFTIMDVKQTANLIDDSEDFRDEIGNQNLKYGAAYYPYLQANFPYQFRFSDINGTTIGSKVDFSSIYSSDTVIKPLLDKFTLLNTDVYNSATGLIKKWKDAKIANLTVDPVTSETHVNNFAVKIWNLLKVFGKPGDLTNLGLKAYLENLIAISLKPVSQKLVDLESRYKAIVGAYVTEYDKTATKNAFDDAPWKYGGSDFKASESKLPVEVNLYVKLLTSDPDTLDSVPDYAKIKAQLNKLYTSIVSGLDNLITSIENYVLEEENNLTSNIPIYPAIISKLSQSMNTVPPSGAIAGIYAQIDATRGVWKAPANVSVNSIIGLTDDINDKDQENMNIHETGKSINAIRKFTGRGNLVWGARTLAGNSNDWRYVNVRRLANMIEESVKKACMQFVFEPNVAQTWVNVKGMIENYLTTLWNDGALAGAKPEHAFFVAVGLNQTMSAQDILEGRMIVKIGYAPSRPAEFIILEFKQMQQKS